MIIKSRQLLNSHYGKLVYVEIVLRVKGHYYSAVIILTTTQSIPRLLGAHYMTKLHKNLSMSMSHQHSIYYLLTIN